MKKLLLVVSLFLNLAAFAQIPTNGLVGYYPFTGNANDASGNSNNGTVYGATLTSDRFGNPNSAYLFNGTNSYIDLGIDATLNSILGDFSLSYWVETDSTGGTVFASYSNQGSSAWRIISKIGGTATGGSIPFDGATTQFITGGTWQVSTTTSNLLTYLHWNNVVFTRSGSTTNIYINGVLKYTGIVSAGSINNPTAPAATTRIGVNFPSSTEYYKGSLDDIAIYNRALSQQEVNQVYNTNGSCLVFDTITVNDTVTTHFTVYDTTHITVHDTVTKHIYDTVLTNIYDTIITPLSVTDTLLINVSLTGINPPNNINTVSVYPNPAHDHLEINVGNLNSMAGYSLKITNALGQVVFNNPVNQQSFYIDLNSWTGHGVYILYILDATQTVKSIKEIVLQ